MTDPEPPRARLRVGLGAALILALLGVACAIVLTAVTPHGASSLVVPSPGVSDGPEGGAQEGAAPDAAGGSVIYVHILGQVQHPGLYALRDGDRAVDIVAAAGGFTDIADPAGLNLARFLSDGEQILVPAVGEVVSSGSGTGGVATNGTVNLNTADAAALDSLPRIGPALAQRILDWREQNGRFSSVEDLLDVPGIGQATLEGLRDLVTT
jgi:competence protein ComEA